MRRLILLVCASAVLWSESYAGKTKRGAVPGSHGYQGIANQPSQTQGQINLYRAGNQPLLPKEQQVQSAGTALSNYFLNQQFPTGKQGSFAPQSAKPTPSTQATQASQATQLLNLYTPDPHQLQFNHHYNQYSQPLSSPAIDSVSFVHSFPTVSQSNYGIVSPALGKYFKDLNQPSFSPPQFRHPSFFQSQVYQPLHTQTPVNNPQHPALMTHLAPPTQPRYYSNFQPIVPGKVVSVSETPAPENKPSNGQEERSEAKEENQSVEAEKEEEEEEREKIENDDSDEDDKSHYHEEESADDDDDYRPNNFRYSSKYQHDDDDHDHDHNHSYNNDHDHDHSHSRSDDHDSYHQEDEEDDNHKSSYKYSHNGPVSKYSYKHKYPKVIYSRSFNSKDFGKPSNYEDDNDRYIGPDYKNPKVEYKMYKYTRSSNKPEKREYIESDGSEMIPVVQHNQKTYKEQWIISSKHTNGARK